MQRSVTIRVTVESAPTTHCCASRPIPLPLGYRTARRQRRHLGRQRRIAGYLFRQHTAGYPRTARTGDAGFGFNPVFEGLEMRPAQYAVVARLTQAFRRLLPGLRYEAVNRNWEMTDFEHRPHGWPQARRFVVARRFIPEEEAETTLFTLGRYVYRAWVTNMALTPAGIWHFYDGRAGMEPRIGELREDFALRKIPTASFAANALYLEIIRLAYNLVTAFQRNCLQESWQNLTLTRLRYKLFLLPGELTRPQNRPVLRLRESPMLQNLANDILTKIHRVKPLPS